MHINKERIVTNTLILYVKTLFAMAIAFISTRIVLDGLGVMDFGIFGTVGGSIAMLEALNGAMTQSTQRFLNYAEGQGDREHVVRVFNNTVLLHICLGIVIVLLLAVLYFPLFDYVFNIPADRLTAAKYIYLFLIVSTFFTIITIPYDAMINAHEDFLYYSIVGIVVSLLKLGAAICVVYYLNDRLILYGLLISLITIVNMIVLRLYCHRKYDECVISLRKYGNRSLSKEIGSFAGWNLVGSLANIAGNHGSSILMNHFFGPILIAAKNIGDQICTQVAVLTNNMVKALNPSIVKSEGHGDRETMISLSYNSCRFSFLLYLILSIPFIFNARDLLGIWLKDVPEWAVLFCQLQVTRTQFEQFFLPLNMSLMAQGSVKQMNLIELLLGLLTFLILFSLYRLGFSAPWHYYVSIFFLVFVSGACKTYLCQVKCGIRMIEYLRKVTVPCISVIMLSILVTYVIQLMVGNSHVLLTVCAEFFSLVIIVLLVGLKKAERELVRAKLRHYKNSKSHSEDKQSMMPTGEVKSKVKK